MAIKSNTLGKRKSPYSITSNKRKEPAMAAKKAAPKKAAKKAPKKK
jgi:hypothetical protein